jgi:hypothetical protein
VIGGVVLGRGPEPEVVFDYFAYLRNELQYNGQVSAIRKTSGGPTGQNTTFEGSHRGFGSVSWRLSEFERPKHVVVEGRIGRPGRASLDQRLRARTGRHVDGRQDGMPAAFSVAGLPTGARSHPRLKRRRTFGRMANVFQRDASRTP